MEGADYPENIVAEFWDGNQPADANAALIALARNLLPDLLALYEAAVAVTCASNLPPAIDRLAEAVTRLSAVGEQ